MSKLGPINSAFLEIISADNGVIVRQHYGQHMGATISGPEDTAVFNDPRAFGLWMNEWLCNQLDRNEKAAGRTRS